MGLPSSVSFRSSQIDPTSMMPAAPRQMEPSEDSRRFERHLDESRSKDDRKVDRREDRHQRDRTEGARDTKKASDQDSSKKDADDASTDVAAPVAVVAPPAATVTANAKGAEPEGDAAATDKTSAIPALDAKATPPTDKNAQAKPAAEEEVADPTPKVADATASKAEAKEPDGDKKAATPEIAAPLPEHTASPAQGHQTAKADLKPDVAPASTPVPATQAPVVVAAANANAADAASKPSATATDPDAGLTIKSKEGLGHEAAAGMAEKSGAKTDAAQQQAPNAPAQNATSAAAPTNFAKMVAAATGGDATVTTAGSGSDGGGAARLSDLQNVGGNPQNQTSNTATVRIGTLPGQTTPTQVPVMAIALQVARNLQKGVNRFDIRLDPAEMGRIDVRMEVKKDGHVAAHLTVDRPETLDLLQRDARALQQALNNAGLQANADSLNFSLRDQSGGGNGQAFGASAPDTTSTASNTLADEPVASALYNINLSASGGVDIRV